MDAMAAHVEREEYDAHKESCGHAMRRIEGKLDLIDGAVRGNGKAGLRSELTAVSTRVNGVCWIVGLILGAIVALAFK